MFLFQWVLNCRGYKCRCAEAAGREILQRLIGSDSVNSIGDTLNSFSVRHDVFKQQSTLLAIRMQGHESSRCKRWRTNQTLEAMQKHLLMAQSSSAAFKILLFSPNSLCVTLLNKDVMSSLKLLQKKLARVLCARLAIERSPASKNSSTPREQRDRTVNSRTQKARELRLCKSVASSPCVRESEQEWWQNPHYHCWQLKTLQIAWRYVSHQPTN